MTKRVNTLFELSYIDFGSDVKMLSFNKDEDQIKGSKLKNIVEFASPEKKQLF